MLSCFLWPQCRLPQWFARPIKRQYSIQAVARRSKKYALVPNDRRRAAFAWERHFPKYVGRVPLCGIGPPRYAAIVAWPPPTRPIGWFRCCTEGRSQNEQKPKGAIHLNYVTARSHTNRE